MHRKKICFGEYIMTENYFPIQQNNFFKNYICEKKYLILDNLLL